MKDAETRITVICRKRGEIMKNIVKSRMCELILVIIACVLWLSYACVVFLANQGDSAMADMLLGVLLATFALSQMRYCLIEWWRFTEQHPNWRNQRRSNVEDSDTMYKKLVIGSHGTGKARKVEAPPHQCFNTVLHNVIFSHLDVEGDCAVYKADISLVTLKTAVQQGLLYLEKMYGYAYYQHNEPVAQTLTMRQSSCADAAIQCVKKGKYNQAAHELLDCIDNYGESQREPRLITVNEYFYYILLLKGILLMMEDSDKEEK